MDVDKSVDSNEKVWEDINLSISKIRWDLIDDTDTIEHHLTEIHEKKICLEKVDDEKAEFEKIHEKAVSSSSLKSQITVLDNYQPLSLFEEWKNRKAVASKLLLQFSKEK